jgi:ATP-dependent protease ClpP protease subunit
LKRYATVIGEITAETFERYAERAHVGPIPDRCVDLNPCDGVVISSPGGDVGYTLAILDDIDYWKRETLATGICQSAAAVLATCGEGKRICTMDTLFRFMPSETALMENPDNPGEMVQRVPDLRAYLQSVLVARVAQRLNIPKIEADLLFDGKFITSIRAQELGLIDKVISTEGTPNAGNSDRL